LPDYKPPTGTSKPDATAPRPHHPDTIGRDGKDNPHEGIGDDFT